MNTLYTYKYDYDEVSFFYKNSDCRFASERFTVAYRMLPNDLQVECAVAVCNIQDNFDKKVGKKLAKERLLNKTKPFYFVFDVIDILTTDIFVAHSLIGDIIAFEPEFLEEVNSRYKFKCVDYEFNTKLFMEYNAELAQYLFSENIMIPNLHRKAFYKFFEYTPLGDIAVKEYRKLDK